MNKCQDEEDSESRPNIYIVGQIVIQFDVQDILSVLKSLRQVCISFDLVQLSIPILMTQDFLKNLAQAKYEDSEQFYKAIVSLFPETSMVFLHSCYFHSIDHNQTTEICRLSKGDKRECM